MRNCPQFTFKIEKLQIMQKNLLWKPANFYNESLSEATYADVDVRMCVMIQIDPFTLQSCVKHTRNEVVKLGASNVLLAEVAPTLYITAYMLGIRTGKLTFIYCKQLYL